MLESIIESINLRYKTDLELYNTEQIGVYIGRNRREQWEKYRDVYGMPDGEFDNTIADSIGLLRSRIINYVEATRPDFDDNPTYFGSMQYTDPERVFTEACIPPGDEVVVMPFDRDGLLTWGRAEIRRGMYHLCLYQIIAMRVFEETMKVNQNGSGGRGGLMINYPH